MATELSIPTPAAARALPRPERIALSNNLRHNGMAWSAVRAITGLNHVVSELEYMRFVLPADQRVEATAKNARDLRDVRQLSWGEIAVRLGVSEGRARKLYAEGAGVLSEGQRIGKGGRWLGNDSELYVAELNPTGTKITPEAGRRNARKLAVQQRLAKMETGALKAFAADHGVTVKGKTPAQIILAVQKALGVDKLEAAGTATTAAPAKAPKATKVEGEQVAS